MTPLRRQARGGGTLSPAANEKTTDLTKGTIMAHSPEVMSHAVSRCIHRT